MATGPTPDFAPDLASNLAPNLAPGLPPELDWEPQPDIDLSGGWPGLAMEHKKDVSEGDADWIEALNNDGKARESDWASHFRQELADLETNPTIALDDAFFW